MNCQNFILAVRSAGRMGMVQAFQITIIEKEKKALAIQGFLTIVVFLLTAAGFTSIRVVKRARHVGAFLCVIRYLVLEALL